MFLTAGQTQAVFTQRHIQASRVVADDLIQTETFECSQQVLVGRIAVGTRQIHVFAQCTQEKAWRLAEQEDLVTQEIRIKLAHIDAVEGYVAFFGIVQTARQLQHGTFTAADTSEDTDFFTGSDVDAQLVNCVVAFVFVFERYVFKSDIALNVVQSNVFAFGAAFDRTGNNVVHAS